MPPPMSSYQIRLPSPPVHIATLPTRDSVVALFPSGTYHIWDLHTRIPKSGGRGGGKVAEPKLVEEGRFENGEQVAEYRQVAVDEEGRVFALVTLSGGEDAVIRQDGDLQVSERPLGRIVSGITRGIISIDTDGEVCVAGGKRYLLFRNRVAVLLIAIRRETGRTAVILLRCTGFTVCRGLLRVAVVRSRCCQHPSRIATFIQRRSLRCGSG